MDIFSEEDIKNFRIVEFMEAIGYDPVKINGEKFIYNAPYNISTLYRAYGIITKGHPTCEVDIGTNRWRDNKWINYAGGNLRSLVLEMFNYPYDPTIVNKFILDTMTEYNREKPVYLQPLPRVSPLRLNKAASGIVLVDDIPMNKFLECLGYSLIGRQGNVLSYKDYRDNPCPYVDVDVSENTWRDRRSGFSGSIYDFTSMVYGGKNHSEVLRNIAYIYDRETVTEMRRPWGPKQEKSLVCDRLLRKKSDIGQSPPPKRRRL